jgi:hypothetical protein
MNTHYPAPSQEVKVRKLLKRKAIEFALQPNVDIFEKISTFQSSKGDGECQLWQ